MILCLRGIRAARLPALFAVLIFAPGSMAALATKKVPDEKQIEEWCRELKDKKASSAYSKLASFAARRDSGELGLRVALALGYYDYTQGRYPEAQRWLEKATADPILRDYALYWSAQAIRARGDNARALAQLEIFRRDFPRSVMSAQALQAITETELALGRPQDALDALASDPSTSMRPELLFLRAQALEQSSHLEPAAADYLAVYYRFPLSAPSREAGMKMQYLLGTLGGKFPIVPLEQRISRASALFASHDWGPARDEYETLVSQLTGADRDRAELRLLQCRVALGADPSVLADLKIEDPEADAERLFNLSQTYRARLQEPEMLAAIEQAVRRAPQSAWAEQALFAAGNYFWVVLDRTRAAAYYQRLEEAFPTSFDADAAQWRLAWSAYRDRRLEAAALFEEHIRRFPGSAYTADALYWLGREAERTGHAALARSYYAKLIVRFPQNYFQVLAAPRLGALGAGMAGDAAALALIPPLPPVQPVSNSIPPEAADRQKRAGALRSIAFDASAELELRTAFAATGEPRLLLEAASEADNAGHYGAAFATVRQIYPQLESRRIVDVPEEIWHVAYPLPFAEEMRRASSRARLDPMLVAGLVRQESTFDPMAVSHAGAHGLMQLLPKTARKMARELRVRYLRVRLFEPDYNLRLGTAYLSSLEKNFGSVEAALAAYNAGEDRVAAWQAGQTYEETAEFVESIPFTETREYVQIVMRNAEIYRKLYGGER